MNQEIKEKPYIQWDDPKDWKLNEGDKKSKIFTFVIIIDTIFTIGFIGYMLFHL